MTMPIRIAAAAVIGVLAVGGAFFLSRPAQPSVGPPGLTPSASASASTLLEPDRLAGRAIEMSRHHDRAGGRARPRRRRWPSALNSAEIYDPATRHLGRDGLDARCSLLSRRRQAR